MRQPKTEERKTASTHIRFTPSERELIEIAADREGRTVSDYVRRVMVPVASGRARLFEERAA